MKGEGLLRGVGTLRYFSPPNASVQWQPDGLTIHTSKLSLGAGFLGAPPISLKALTRRAIRSVRRAARRADVGRVSLGFALD